MWLKFTKIVAVGLISVLLLLFTNCSNTNSLSSSEPEPVHILITPEDNGGSSTVLEKTSYEPILADRYLLRSIFYENFGPLILKSQSLDILVNPTEFGSPCSIYENYLAPRTPGSVDLIAANNMERCNSRSIGLTRALPNPSPTLTRQASLMRACSDAAENTVTLTYILLKISGSTEIPPTSAENMLKLFKLFYFGKPLPHQGLIDSLLLLAPQGSTESASWKSAVFTVCASSFWQVL